MPWFLLFTLLMALSATDSFGQGRGAITQSTVTCGATSTTLLAANAANNFVKVFVPPTGVIVWVDWSGNAAVAAPPSEAVSPNTSLYWSKGGFLPSTAINCIASTGTQAVTLEYQ